MIATSDAAPVPIITAQAVTALERGWKQLQESTGTVNPFLSWEWQSAWATAMQYRTVCVAQPLGDGRLAGVLALQLGRRHGMAQLEFLGQGSGADELDCLLHPEAPAGTAARLLRAAQQQRHWRLLRLESAAATGALACLFPPAQIEADEWLPTLALPATLDALLASHSANFRSELRRRRRRFFEHWPQARVECASTPSSVAKALPHLFRLHHLRRSQKQQAGVFGSSRVRSFHLQAAPALAQKGLARVYLLRTDNLVFAALYGLEAGPNHARRFLYFQSGFDPSVTALSPGTVLLSAAIEDCMTRGLQRFDFLRGTEAYKTRWTSAGHASVRLVSSRGVAAGAWMKLRSFRQQWVHRKA